MLPPAGPVLAGFAAVVLFAWSPFLAVERVRALFSWPTRWFALNYLAVGAVVLGVQVLSYVVIVLAVAGVGRVDGGEATAIVGGIAASNVAVPGALALAVVRVLPRRGAWSPAADGVDGRVALGLGIGWYALVTTVCVLVVGLAVMFANLPL